jgi:hypothetical protein
MRLTLRTLLAYLDDTLDPVLARQIGEKVAESDTARELMERIKKVTHRRRLTTPEMAGDPVVAVDPNQVADYLDNVIPEDQIGELEKLCLESDVNLAEVAACHQILAVILGEPAQVPPTAYERMYGLVPGTKAASRERAAGRKQGTDFDIVLDGHDDIDSPLLVGVSKTSGWRRWLIPALAAVLLVGLVAVLYIALADRDSSPRGRDYATWQENTPIPQPPRAPVDPSQAVEPLPPTGTGPLWAGWLGTPARAIPDQAGLTLSSVSMTASWMAARPMMPGNWVLIFGHTDESVPAAPPPAPPAKPETTAQPSPKQPSDAQIRVGVHSSQSTRDSLLFRRAGAEEFRLVRPGLAIQTNEQLLTLPGYRSEFLLDNQMRIELVGNLPLTTPNYHLEALATLHGSAEADLDLTLLRGRAVITNKPGGNALVRLRFVDQVWDVRLLQPKSEIGIEIASRIPPGEASWSPHYRFNLYTRGGDVDIKRGLVTYRIQGSKLVPWDNSGAAPPDAQIPQPEAPNWMTRKTPLPDDVRAALVRYATRLGDKLKMGGSYVNWIKVACQESLEESKPWERALGVFCLGSVDHIEALIKELDSEPRAEIRVRALDALNHWIGREPDQDKPLRTALEKRGFSSPDAEMFLRVLKGFKAVDRSVIEMLVANLSSQRLSIRELSYFSLHVVLQLQADKLAGFDPAGPIESREAAVRAIRARVLGKS